MNSMILPPRTNESCRNPPTGRFRDNIQLTLSNPGLWLVAGVAPFAGCLPLRIHRLGVMQLKESGRRQPLSLCGIQNAVLPLGGMAGAFLSGWATERFSPAAVPR